MTPCLSLSPRWGFAALLCLFTLTGCGGGSTPIPGSSPGSGNPGGGTPAPAAAPAIQSIAPSSFPAGATSPTVVTITGTGFTATTQVQVNGTAVATSFVSATQITASVPAALTASGGTLAFIVANGAVTSGGSGSAATVLVTNPVAAITSIDPTGVLVGTSSATLSLTGTGFIRATTVTVGGGIRPTVFNGTTSLSVQLAAADFAAAQSLAVVASNPAPGGGKSNPVSLAVNNPAPVLVSLNPLTAGAGSPAFTLQATGSSFTAGSTLFWNGAALTTTFVSATGLTAQVPAALLATSTAAVVMVTTSAPGGGQSAPVTFNVTAPAPVLTSLLPRNVPLNKDVSIALAGTAFGPNSVALWNGSPRPTTYVSATKLTVSLAAADLATRSTGQLSVSVPPPGGGTTAALPLNITPYPIPTITDVQVVALQLPNDPCQMLYASLTGTNLGQGILLVNGKSMPTYITYIGTETTYIAPVPTPINAAPGTLQFAFQNIANITSDPYALPADAPPVVAVCPSPRGGLIYPGHRFALDFTFSSVNTLVPPAISGFTLPSGITALTTLPVSSGPAAARVLFKADTSLAPATYPLPFAGSSGSLALKGSVNVIAQSAVAPGFTVDSGFQGDVAIPIGGSTTIKISTGWANQNQDYLADLTATGLPAGVTAAFAPSLVLTGDTSQLTLTASANAPTVQNVTVTVTGTPDVNALPASTSLIVSVTPPPGSLPNSRTDFTSLQGTPSAVVYDSAHDLIFASNPAWNRIDVLSNKTHKILQSIPVRSPVALDLTPDNSRLWIGNNSQHVYSLDTSSFALTTYSLPNLPDQFYPTWNDNRLFALADGTLLLNVSPGPGQGIYFNAIWSPLTGQLTQLQGVAYSARFYAKSGDGKFVYGSPLNPYSCQFLARALSGQILTGNFCNVYAANQDGTRLIVDAPQISNVNPAYSVLDGSLQPLGELPLKMTTSLNREGGFAFARDGSTLYQIGSLAGVGEAIATYDVPTLTVKGIAPALFIIPASFSWLATETTLAFTPDADGVLIGIQNYGVGFDDSTFFQHYGMVQAGLIFPNSRKPESGPLTGGTVTDIYGSAELIPDAWYGSHRGTAALVGSALSITSPTGDAPGPVNLKFIFPNGLQTFTEDGFAYSAVPQQSLFSGAPPAGGVRGRISGFGMPVDGSQGSVTVGGRAANITTTVGRDTPSTPEPVLSTYLDFTIPSGSPGYADLQVTSPAGSGTLSKAVFYAKSLNDYGSSDHFTDLLYDAKRQRIYLSTKNHVAVFSLASNQFVTSITPPSLGSTSDFRGLALTPDGSQLLITNLSDGSLAVVNPDNTAASFAIALAPAQYLGTTCAIGPSSVAGLAGQQAIVTPPVQAVNGCLNVGPAFLVDLKAHSASSFYPNCTSSYGPSQVDSTSDGSLSALRAGSNLCLYSTALHQVSSGSPTITTSSGVAISGDGNLIATENNAADSAGNILGSNARPIALYGTVFTSPFAAPVDSIALTRPRLNASGSLLFQAFRNSFEIIDESTGTLKMRFSLAETIQDVGSPIAIDEGGRQVFLITDAGLTVVDLGTAPLSIGHLTPAAGSAGTQIQVRGSGFISGLTATLDSTAASVTVTDENTLTLTLPGTAAGPHDLTLTNPDGTKYTLKGAVTAP